MIKATEKKPNARPRIIRHGLPGIARSHVEKIQQQQIAHILRNKNIQAKHIIGQPHDNYEQQADRVANKIMVMPEQAVQRQSDESKEEKEAEPEREEEAVQTKSMADKPTLVTAGLQSRIQSLKGGGHALPRSERAFFEPRFGADFSHVRIHNDASAANIARSINARAYTLGEDIGFAEGQYAPQSGEGRRLLAHELTHTLQQQRSTAADGKRPAGTDIHSIARTTIQRWEASEHVHIGKQIYTAEAMKHHFKQVVGIDATARLQLANAQISYADAVAMADLFANFEEMYNAPSHEIKRHLEIIKKEKALLITRSKGKSVKQKWSKAQKKILAQIDLSFTKATGTRYIELAKGNFTHFTHSHIRGGMNNIRQWKKLHAEAADAARKAKKSRSGTQLSQAFARNAFADHYLSDAFAVGHLTGRAETKVERETRKKLRKKMSTIIATVLMEKVASKWYGVIALILPLISQIMVLGINLASTVVAGLKDIAALPFKIIHDLDNKFGRMVTNAKQEKWDAYGDKYLMRSENLRSNYPRVIKAVKVSKDEIVESALKDETPKNRPEKLYPSTFAEPRWKFKDALQFLKQLIHSYFPMLKLFLFNVDDLMRKYINKTRPNEMYRIPVNSKVAMIKILLSGPTLNEDEQAILKVLRYSLVQHLWGIVNKIGFTNLKSDIHGKEYKQFITLLANRFYKLPLAHQVAFVRMLLKGATLNVEENGILRLLGNNKPNIVYKIIRSIGFKRIADDIHGGEYNKFIYILESKYRHLNRYAKKELIESLLKVSTGDLEEWAIKEILRNAGPEDVAYAISAIGFSKYHDNIHGPEYRQFLNVLVGKYRHLGAGEKIRLIKALCRGWTSEVEEETIVLLLKDASPTDFKTVVRAVGKKRLYKELTGREEDQFEVMLSNAGMK